MTLADRLAEVLRECGPMPASRLAKAACKRKADVLAVLGSDPRFEHSGSRRASRWAWVGPARATTPTFTAEQLTAMKASWDCRPDEPGCSPEMAAVFLADFERLGVVERVDGIGRFRMTGRGLGLAKGLLEVNP